MVEFTILRYKRFMHRLALVFFTTGLLFVACSRRGDVKVENTQPDPYGLVIVMVSGPESDAAEPAIASDKDGNIYVAYVEHNADKTADLFIHKYDRDARTVGEMARVNPVPGTVKAWRGDPPVMTTANDGTLYVGWVLRAGQDGNGGGVVLSASKDGGRTFTGPVRVNDDNGRAAYGMVSLISDTGGQLYMAWLDERNVKKEPGHEDPKPAAVMMFHHTKEPAEPNSEVYYSVSSDGGKTFSANKKIASEVCPCCKTSMAAAPDGRVYVSWRQVLPGGLRHIAVAASADKGASFSGGVVVSDDKWKIDACPVSGASLSAVEGGALSVSWYSAGEAGEAGIYSAESRDAGKTFGPRHLINAAAVSGTPVLSGNNSCVFAVRENTVAVRTGQGEIVSIPDASLPSAVTVAGKTYVAFVRISGEKRSVWVALLP